MSDFIKEDEILGKLFPNKIITFIWFIVWCTIYKILDMNTLQWFGEDIFIRGGKGLFHIIGFFIASAFALSVIILILG